MTDIFIYTALKTQGVNNVLLDGHITTSFTKVDRKLHKLELGRKTGEGYVQDVVHFPEADVTVALVVCAAAKNAHTHYLREGFEYPYEFKPHITLARGNQVDSLKRQGVVGMSFEIIGEYVGFVEEES